MPFSPQSLSVLARNDDFTLWRYECAEDPADLLAAGYFLPAAGILRRGDLVSCVSVGTNAAAGQRTALLVADAGPGRVVVEPLQSLPPTALAALADVRVGEANADEVLTFADGGWTNRPAPGRAGDAFAAAHAGAAGAEAHASATPAEAGFMAAADKQKLDRIEAGATGDQTGSELVEAIDGELGGADWREDASAWGAFHGKALGSALVERDGAIDVDVASVVASVPRTRAISAPAGEDPSISLELPAAVDRRDFLLAFTATGAVTTTKVATAAAIETLARDLLSISPSSTPTVHEIDVSAYHSAIVPRGHGRLVALGTPYAARYPSRDQSMQCMIFIGDKTGLLVQTKDPVGYITDWELLPEKKLRLTLHGPDREIFTVRTSGDWREGATAYSAWAREQYWARAARSTESLNVIAVGSNPNLADLEQSAVKFVRAFSGKKTACWLTQWRRYPYDQYYPNYEPNSQQHFSEFLRLLRSMNCVPLPHMNAVLWDLRTSEPPFNPNVMLLTKDGGYSRGAGNYTNLAFACPSSASWRDVVVMARESLKDSDGNISDGVYLDLIGATKPQICYSSLHGHAPGDPLAWQLGTRRLYQSIRGFVMSEGVAEIYLDLVTLSLMHLNTDRSDTVPLWDVVYGFLKKSVGWVIPRAAEAPEIEAEINRATLQYGVQSKGSPWMSSVIQDQILKDAGGLLERLVNSA